MCVGVRGVLASVRTCVAYIGVIVGDVGGEWVNMTMMEGESEALQLVGSTKNRGQDFPKRK